MTGSAPAGGDPAERLLCVAPLEPGYGVETVLTAFGMLATDRPGLHLDLVGAGPLAATLLAQARTLTLEDRVHLSGPGITDGALGFGALVLPRPVDRFPGAEAGHAVMLDVVPGRWSADGLEASGRWHAVLQSAPTLLVSPDDPVGLAVAVAAVLDGPARAAPPGRRARRGPVRACGGALPARARPAGARGWVAG